MNNSSFIPDFWPSGRLWLKFFIGVIYVPLLFALLFWIFFQALFLRGLYLLLLFLLFVGGPISIGLLLSPDRRGVGAGLIAVITIPLIWYMSGFVSQYFNFIEIDLLLGLAAGGVSILLEMITGDVRVRAEMVGLGIGFAMGLSLIFLNNFLFGSFHYKGNDALMLLSLGIPNALVWLSTLFFPEWASRKVGWGGLIVWIVLISIVFGISFMLMI